MKVKELSIILKKINLILEFYSDKSINEALDDIVEILRSEKKENKQENDQAKEKVDLEIDLKILMKELDKANVEEIEVLLKNKPKKVLLKIAKNLSISSSSRQSIATLSHSISKYYERRKIDDIIINGRYE